MCFKQLFSTPSSAPLSQQLFKALTQLFVDLKLALRALSTFISFLKEVLLSFTLTLQQLEISQIITSNQ